MKRKYCFVSYRVSRRLCLPGILPMLVALALATPKTHAASGSWIPTAAGTYAWATAGNWTGGVPNAATDVATITSDLAGAQTITLGANRTVTDLNLGDSGTATPFGFTIAPGVAGSTLVLAGTTPTIDVNGANVVNTISAPIQLQGTGTFRSTTTAEVALSGVISNNGTVRNMAFNNDLNGTATAAASLQGQFALNAANTAGGATGTVAISDVRVRATVAGAFGANAANAVTMTGAGQAYLTGGTHVNNFNLNSTGWVETSGNFGALRIENATVSGAVTMQQNSRIACNSGSAGTISGALTGPYTLTKNGTGALILTGANRYGGMTFVTDGQLRFGSAAAMGNSPAVVVSSGRDATTSVQLNGGFAFGAGRSLTLRNGANNNQRAELGNTANNNSWDGSILLESPTAGVRNQTLTAASGTTLTINGNITNSATLPSAGMFVRGVGNGVLNGTFSLGDALLLKTDGGTWTINSTGNIQGSTTLAVGGLVINNTNALQPDRPLIMGQSDANSSTLTINSGFSQNFSTITVLGGGSGAFNITGAGSLDTGTAGIPLTVNDTSTADDLTLSTAVSGTGGFTKSGAGTLNLNGATIAGPVALAGGTTRGNATFNGGLSVDATATLMPGSATTAGTFTTTTLALTGGTLAVNLGDAGSDVINVTSAGGLTQSGTTTIQITPNGNLNPASTFYPIIGYNGTSPGVTGFALGTLPGRVAATLTDTGTAIGITATNDRVIWTGTLDGNWTGIGNWKKESDAGVTSFLPQDSVIFNNDGIAQNTIALTGTIDPVRVEFAHTSGAYTLASGTLSGSGAMPLIHSGAGTTILRNANTYTGATIINAGTLELDHTSGTMTATSGVAVDLGATLKLTANDGGFTFSRNLSGAGTVIVDPHSVAAAASREIAITGTNTNFTGTLKFSPTVFGNAGTGTFRTNAALHPANVGAATVKVDAGAQAWLANGTFPNNFIITGHGYAEAAGGTPTAGSGLTAYTGGTPGGIGAIRASASTITGTITLEGSAKIQAYGATVTLAGALSTTNSTDMLVLGGGGSGSTTILTAINNSGANPLRKIYINSGGSAGGTDLLQVGDGGTLGTDDVLLHADAAKSATLRIQRADGYTLGTGQDILAADIAATADYARTALHVATAGSGLSTGANTIDLSDGTTGGNLHVGINGVNGSILNIDAGATVDVGYFTLGEASGLVGTVNQAGGTTSVIRQLRVGHYPNNTSVYNLAGGSLSITGANPGTNPFAGTEQDGGIYVGVDGSGVFNQSGGTVSTNWVVLDNRGETAGVDQYNLTGGTLTIKNTWGISGNPLTMLTLGGGKLAIDNAGPITVPVSVPLTVTGTSSVLDTGVAGNAFTLSANLAGDGTLTTQGGGILNLSTTGIQTVTPIIAGTSPVTKLGTGTTTLAAANTYSGATTVSAGRLNLTGSLANSAVSVKHLAGLGGEGSAASLTFGETGTDTANLFVDGATAGALTSTGALTVNGKVLVNLAAAPAGPGTVTVLNHGGTTAAASSFELVNAANYRTSTFNVDSTKVTLDFTNKDLKWDGTTATWEIGGTDNDWNGPADDNFFTGDNVTFDGTYVTTDQTVTMVGALLPGAVTVSGDTINYVLTGSGFSGAGGLTKTGAANLELGGANTFTGPVAISGGTVKLATTTALGSGTGVTISGTGTLDLGALTANALNLGTQVVTISGAGADGFGAITQSGANQQQNAFRLVTLAGDATIGGTGRYDIRGTTAVLDLAGKKLTKEGSNVVYVTVDGTITPGDMEVNAGTLGIWNGTVLGAGNIRANSGGIVELSNMVAGKFDRQLTLNGGSVTSGSANGATSSGPVIYTAASTINNANALTLTGPITETGGSFDLVKTGAGSLNIAGTNGLTGKVNVTAGILRVPTDATLGPVPGAPVADSITLQGGGRIQAGNATAGVDLTVDPNRGIKLPSGDGGFHVWTGFTLNYAGTITGVGNLAKTDGGTWNFTGTADHTGTTIANGGVWNLNGASIPATSSVRTVGGTLNINPGTVITTGRFVVNDASNATSIINQTGGVVNIAGTDSTNTNTASFLFGHWGGGNTGTYNLSGGTLNSLGAELSFGWDTTTSLFNQTGGVANLLGLDFGNTRNNFAAYTLNGGRLNLGLNGVTANANKVFNLGGGTLGAFADWTSAQLMTLTGVNGNTTVDTLDSADALTARTITLSGAVNGTGNLVKTGAGTLILGGVNGLTGSLTVNDGTLRIQAGNDRSVASITVNAGATLQTAATNFFVLDHGNAVAASRLITVNGGTWTMEAGDYRLGNIALANGATWTSLPDTAWGILLANNSAGASTVSVSGTSPSVMNGAGALRLQGVQNFAVADVTGSAAADLTVSLILRGAGNALGAPGGVNKTGAGTLVLATGVTHDYDGATTVSEGTLIVDGTLSASAATVNNTGTLGGSGTLAQAAVVATGGTVSPGNSVGTLNFGATLDLNAGSTYLAEITGATTSDKLTVTGALTANGTVKVKLVGYAPIAGNAFDLVDAAGITGTPTFDFSEAVLAAGLAWDTSDFATTGVVKVISSDPYLAWASLYGVTGGKAGDDDGDGVINLVEFATNSNAKSGASRANVYPKMHVLGGVNALTYTVAVRKDAVFAPGSPDASMQEATKDKVKYTVMASDQLGVWNTVVVSELDAVDSAAVRAAITPALPTLDADWQWHTFRTDGGAPADRSDFIRLQVTEVP